MSSKRIVAWRPACGVAVIGVIALGWCLQSPSVADVPVGARVKSVRPLQRVNTGDVGRETVQMRERGIPWRHVTPTTDAGQGGVAGPACLCNKDCDAGDPCAGGICTGGVCSFSASNADGDACDDGNADGLFCTTGLCNAGTCDANQGGAGNVCPGNDGEAGTADDDLCDESQDRCEQCTADGDCPFSEPADACAPQQCNAQQRCELDGSNLPCPGNHGCEDVEGNPVCGPIDTDGRCCQADGTCQEDITRTDCEASGGLWNPIGQCPCPKYGAGFTPDAFIEGTSDTIFSLLVEPAANCDTRSVLGDDYNIANGSFMSLEYMQIAVEVEADNTDLLFSFYDTNFNLVGQDVVLDIDVDDDNDGSPDGFIRFNNTPSLGQLILPPSGWWTVEVTSNTGGARFLSTDAVDVGANNADLLWENNVQGQILPAGLNILNCELAGTKVQAPVGACCSEDGQTCTENRLPWECAAGENHVLGGTCPGACESGSCCLINGFCCDSNNVGDDPGCDVVVISSQGNCEGGGGVWNGLATDCSTDCCVQTPTGATVCSGAVDHPLDISGACIPDGQGGTVCPTASATYTGDTRDITNGTCSVSGLPCATNNAPVPGGSDTACDSDIADNVCVADDDWCALLGASTGAGDPVYFEKFSINQDANVTIEYCGTGFCPGQDPGPGPNGGVAVRFTIILPSCQEDGADTCGLNDAIPYTSGIIQPFCDDANTIDLYEDVPGPNAAGGFQEYRYPIFSGKTCSLTTDSCQVTSDCQPGETCDKNALNYQLRITATALAPLACCLVNAGVPECSLLSRPTCEALGGFSIENAPLCFPGNVCDTGSCCLPIGSCDDNTGAGITISECNALEGTYFGGSRCTDDPCPVCEIEEPGFCQTNNGNLILINDSEVQNNSWADDFRPTASGPASEWCFEVCFYNPTAEVECFQSPPPDDFTITIYENGGGVPGTLVIPPSQIDVIAKAPRNIQSSRCWEYSFNLPNAPFLNAGACYFVQMEGTGDPGGAGCTTYIRTSADGNSYIVRDTGGGWFAVTSFGNPPDSAVDLSFCMNLGLDVANGGCGDWVGACCLPDLSCQDNVAHPTCVDLGGVPFPLTSCGEDLCPGGCEQDDCITGEVPNLNDPADPGDCDAGLLAGDCTRPFSNIFCDPTTIGTVCSIQGEPPAPNNAFGSDTWAVYTMQEGECGEVTISTCPADGGGFAGDGMLAAYVMPAGAGCPADIVNPTACGDDTCGFGSGPATITVQANQGQDVYIRMGGWNGAQGAGTMILSLDANPCPGGVERPNPDPVIDLEGTTFACSTDVDCPGETYCILEADGTFPSVCYAPANRYLSILPNILNTSLTARRVSIDANGNGLLDPGIDIVLGWVGEPFATNVTGPEPSPQAQSRVSQTSIYRDWNDLTDVDASLTGAVAVRMGDCEISPGYFYFVQAINLGEDEGNESNYSLPLTLRTVAVWADVIGPSNAPDGVAAIEDSDAIVAGFQGNQTIPKYRLELTGGQLIDNVPDFGIVSLPDVFAAILATEGAAYPYDAPCDCPGQPCSDEIDVVPCCLPGGSCAVISVASCAASGTPVAECLGDGNGDGVDDACADCLCDGDLTGSPLCTPPDGVVNLTDVLYVTQCLENGVDPCGGPLETCDINCDGDVNAIDLGIVTLQFQGVEDTCNLPVGGCCTASEFFAPCTVVQESVCTSAFGGIYMGDGTVCIAECPVGDPTCDDCNLNGETDFCDIATGVSEDVDLDGVPDECSGYTGDGGDGNWSNPANWSDDTVPDDSGEDEFFVTIDAADVPVSSAWDAGYGQQATGSGRGLVDGGVESQFQALPPPILVRLDIPVTVQTLSLRNGAHLLVEAVAAVGDPVVVFAVVGPGGVVVHSMPNYNYSLLQMGEAQGVQVQNGPTTIGAGGAIALEPGVSPGDSTYTTQSLVITTDCGACDPGLVTVTGSMGLTTTGNLELIAPDGCTEFCTASATAGPAVTPAPTLSTSGNTPINIGGDLLMEAGTGIVVNVVSSLPAIFLGGDFLLEMTDSDLFQWSDGALVLNGVEAQFMEVGDADVGPLVGGLGVVGNGVGFSIPEVIVDNLEMAFGDIVVNHASSPPPCPCAEAFYVGTLSFADGSNLILDNVRVYYDELIGENLTITRIGCGDLILNPSVDTVRPEPEPNTSEEPCCVDADCVNETVCVPAVDGGELGTCYVPTNRYLAIRPQNANELTALRVKHDGGSAWFVSKALHANGYHTLLPLTAATDLIFANWSDMEPTILVSGCQISPETSYAVQAIREADYPPEGLPDELLYSVPLRLPTTKFGDVVDTAAPIDGVLLPADGLRNLIDVFAVVRRFTQEPPFPPLTWVNVDEPMNGTVNLSDAFWVVLAFQGKPYFDFATADSCSCPGNCGNGCLGGATCFNRCTGGFNDDGACDPSVGNADCEDGQSNGVCNQQSTCAACP